MKKIYYAANTLLAVIGIGLSACKSSDPVEIPPLNTTIEATVTSESTPTPLRSILEESAEDSFRLPQYPPTVQPTIDETVTTIIENPKAESTSVALETPPAVRTPAAIETPSIESQQPEIYGSLQDLQVSLEQKINEHAGYVGFAALDLNTGETISIYGDREIVAASSIKFFVMLSVLRDIEAGKYKLDAVESTLNDMIYDSDNYATAVLTNKTGIENVNELMDELGMKNSIFADWSEYGYNNNYSSGENYLTADETVAALAKLFQGEIFDDTQFTAIAIEKLEQASYPYIIKRFLPDNVTVAHKAGWIPYDSVNPASLEVHNDIGIVNFEQNGQQNTYVIAFLSQNNNDHNRAAVLGGNLTKMTHEYFTRK